MTTTKIYHCDLCEKQVEKFVSYSNESIERVALIKKEATADYKHGWKEICTDCHTRLINFSKSMNDKTSAHICSKEDIYERELLASELSLKQIAKLFFRKLFR